MNGSQALWSLEQGQALRMTLGPGERELRVTSGRLWLTPTASRAHASADLVLQAGDSLVLRSGTELVMEGWPSAAFQLLVPPSACPGLAQQLLQQRSAAAVATKGAANALPPGLAAA